jgi:hypothetical protein
LENTQGFLKQQDAITFSESAADAQQPHEPKSQKGVKTNSTTKALLIGPKPLTAF